MAVQSKPPVIPTAREAEISTRPSRLRWSIGEVVTKDGHRILLAFTCSVAIVDEPAERNLMAEVCSSRNAITAAAVISHFLPSLQSAASDWAARETAEVLLSPDARAGWTATLKTAANEVAFSCGLEVLAPFDTEVSSPTLQRERLERMQRIAAERRSADRVGHFARAAELLKHWESLKSSVPSVTPGKLLEQVNPADRGLMLDTLLMAGAGNHTGRSMPDLWAVSGQSLVRVDLKTESPQPQVIPLPAEPGPLRSITPAQGKLLIGARSGVMMVDPSNLRVTTVYLQPTLTSEHGFTSVCAIGDRIWACHRVGGLVGWRIGDVQQPDVVFTPEQLGGEPKNLTAAGLFGVGAKLCRLSPALKIESVIDIGSPIVAILSVDGQFIIAGENGSLTLVDEHTLEKLNDIQTTGRLTGAALLPWLSSSRLLLNRADGAIDCIGLEDQLLTQFNSGQTGMRAATACGGKIAAMSSDRQRVLLWNPWDGRKTAGEIYLAGITRHRVADLAFG